FNKELALLSEETGMLGRQALISGVAQIAFGTAYDELMIEKLVAVPDTAIGLNVLQFISRNQSKLRRGANNGMCCCGLRRQLRVPDDLEDIALLALSFEGKFPKEARLDFAAAGDLLVQRI